MTDQPQHGAPGTGRPAEPGQSSPPSAPLPSTDPLVSRARVALLGVLLEVQPEARRGLIRIERLMRRRRQRRAGWREAVAKALAGWRQALHLTPERLAGPEDWVDNVLWDSLWRHIHALDSWRSAPRAARRLFRRPRLEISTQAHVPAPRPPQPPRYDPLAMTEKEADHKWQRYKDAVKAHVGALEATRGRRRACEDDRWRRKISKEECYRLLAEHVTQAASYRDLAKRLASREERGIAVTPQAVREAVNDLAVLIGLLPEPRAGRTRPPPEDLQRGARRVKATGRPYNVRSPNASDTSQERKESARATRSARRTPTP
jgi:hypothetical protein